MPVRSTRDVIIDHLQCRLSGDVETDIARNYARDVVLLTGVGVLRGHDGVRESAAILADDLPGASYELLTLLVEGEHALLEWRADADAVRCEDGADGFFVRDGRIAAQTIHYTLHHRAGFHEVIEHRYRARSVEASLVAAAAAAD